MDSRLFVPDEWFDKAHAERRKACGIPENLSHQTRPEIGLALLQAAVERNEQTPKKLCRFSGRRPMSCMAMRPPFAMRSPP